MQLQQKDIWRYSGIAAAAVAGWVLARRVAYRCWRQPDPAGISRTVVVTGGGSGLGRQVCEQLLARGDIVVALDIAAEGLAALETASASSPGHLITLVANVADWDSVEKAVAAASKDLRKVRGDGWSTEAPIIDAIVNFAGLIRGGPLVELKPSDMKATMDVNVLGTFHVNRAFFSLMRRTGHGISPKIVNVGSEVSYSGLSAAMNAPYSMSKFAIEAYSTALRQELAMLRDGPVPVVVVNPGAMRTPMTADQRMGGPNQFFERHSSMPGTLYMPALLAGAKVASKYMERNSHDPKMVSDIIEEIVHLRWPRRRYLVGVSREMHMVRWTPQVIIDFALRFTFSNAS